MGCPMTPSAISAARLTSGWRKAAIQIGRSVRSGGGGASHLSMLKSCL